ncbi:hypothetical protein X801_09750 [Opisthorchis viverrini]|uniref:Uncharacterized protein n=1 Tax=Opisthorchis viverrini TaxID=6198 RepID=A0A1S8WJ35_OPIVI|nr:hypothetical protein X801_09750 [Opisthorchis viverrini]
MEDVGPQDAEADPAHVPGHGLPAGEAEASTMAGGPATGATTAEDGLRMHDAQPPDRDPQPVPGLLVITV